MTEMVSCEIKAWGHVQLQGTAFHVNPISLWSHLADRQRAVPVVVPLQRHAQKHVAHQRHHLVQKQADDFMGEAF